MVDGHGHRKCLAPVHRRLLSPPCGCTRGLLVTTHHSTWLGCATLQANTSVPGLPHWNHSKSMLHSDMDLDGDSTVGFDEFQR